MKKRILDNWKPGLWAAGVLFALLLIVIWLVGAPSAPKNPMEGREADPSRMYVTSSILAMDRELLAGMENANAAPGEESDTTKGDAGEESETPPEDQEQSHETDRTHLAELREEYEDREELPDQLTPDQGNSNGQQTAENGQTSGNDPGSGSGSGSGNGEGPGDGDGSGTGNGEPGDNISYFTTDIMDGTTVSVPTYSFHIGLTAEAAERGYALLNTLVYVNGSRISFTSGDQVDLKEGENVLLVSVRVRGKNFEIVDAPFRTYHIYYTPEGHIFLGVYRYESREEITDGASYTVTAADFPIQVTATDSEGKAVPATVMLNRSRVSVSGDHYPLRLVPGTNTLTVNAGTGAARKSVTATLQYDTDAFVLSFESDAITEQITGDRFGENTYVEYPSPTQQLNVRLTCSAGRDHITSVVVQGSEAPMEMINSVNANGNFTLQLSGSGETAIRVTCKDDKNVTRQYTWRIKFIRNGGYGDEKRPSIQTNLTTEVLNVQDFVLAVSAVSNGSSQKQLTNPNNFDIRLNGEPLVLSGHSGAALEYRLHLMEGANSLQITVTDDEQYQASRDLTVTYVPDVADVSVTVICDASVLGLGQWVADHVSVPSDVTIAQIMEERLAAHGISTIHSGSTTTGDYYLAHLIRAGITNGWRLTDEQRAYYEAGGNPIMEDVPADSLGEFDFTMNSGWMITLNGYFIGGGMGTRTVRDGDVIHVQFTLNRGADIGVNPDSDIYG